MKSKLNITLKVCEQVMVSIYSSCKITVTVSHNKVSLHRLLFMHTIIVKCFLFNSVSSCGEQWRQSCTLFVNLSVTFDNSILGLTENQQLNSNGDRNDTLWFFNFFSVHEILLLICAAVVKVGVFPHFSTDIICLHF